MLILTRREHEDIILTIDAAIPLGSRIVVTTLGIKGAQVRIGVDAPKEVGVYRAELLARIERNERGD
jgi:carbon storage regulator